MALPQLLVITQSLGAVAEGQRQTVMPQEVQEVPLYLVLAVEPLARV